jgi:hypothetical protein
VAKRLSSKHKALSLNPRNTHTLIKHINVHIRNKKGSITAYLGIIIKFNIGNPIEIILDISLKGSPKKINEMCWV